MNDLKIIIAGAGLGGLALGQALARAGIDFQIFERDRGPFDRPQGYRLHLDADAIYAAKEALPPDLYALFEATSQWTEPYTTILDTDLSVRKRLLTDDDHGDAWPRLGGPPLHANVDRATLRQIFLAGMEDRIHFGKRLDHYETSPEVVTAHFDDGTSAAGQLLVGADGIRSVVRRQRAPLIDNLDAGITAIYGRIAREEAAPFLPIEALEDIFTIASDERKVFLGLGSVKFPMRPDQAATRFSPGTKIRPQDDYVVAIVGGRHEYFPDDLKGASGERLQRVAAQALGTWPSSAASTVLAGNPDSFFVVEMDTSVPFALDEPTNVTLLGDAVHAMTPTLGRGANLAMRDGVLLARELRRAARRETTLAEALARYERGMLEYGFAVVREAAAIGRQRMAQNPLPGEATR